MAESQIIREESTPSHTIQSVSASSTTIRASRLGAGNGEVEWDNINATYFKFTSIPALISGNVFQWYNDSDFLLGLTFDGILQFKEQSALPNSLTGGLLLYDNNLYLGQS